MTATGVPPIPESRASAYANARETALLWVYRGVASVRVEGRRHVIGSGTGLAIPAGLAYDLRVAPDSVVLPIFLGACPPQTLSRVEKIEIADAWSTWLVYQFARSMGYLKGATSSTSLLDLVASPRASGPIPGPAQVCLPPMPNSPAALRVARSLLRAPEQQSDADQFARSVNVAVRTLHQQFLLETGLAFGRWRTAVRVAAAADYLRMGRTPGEAGRLVGFATPAGFTKAFRAATGMTPGEYRRSRSGQTPEPPQESPTDLVAHDERERGERMRLVLAGCPPQVPQTQTWERVNDFHVLVWLYQGSARASVAGRDRSLRRGEALWLPAGVPHSLTIHPDSLLLPLGSRPATSIDAGPELLVRRFPREAEAYLLHTIVANYSLVRPESHDASAITRLFLESVNIPDIRLSAGPAGRSVATIIDAVRRDPAQQRSLSDWACTLGVDPADLERAFARATGQSYPQWRAQVRMTLARQYLEEGLSVRQIARRLGYAHSSGLTKVFTQAHGMSPTAYRRNGWLHSKEALIVR